MAAAVTVEMMKLDAYQFQMSADWSSVSSPLPKGETHSCVAHPPMTIGDALLPFVLERN